MSMPPAWVDLRGMGLQPPAVPMDWGTRGLAHILQVMPCEPM